MGDVETVREHLSRDPNIVQRLGARELGLISILAEHGSTVGVKTLLDVGFPIDARGESGETPLHFASYRGWPEVVKVLLEHQPPLEVLDSTYQATPLGWALEGMVWNPNPMGDHLAVVRALLEAGSNPDPIRRYAESGEKEREALREVLPLIEAQTL